MSRKRIERLMREVGIAGVPRARKFRITVRNPDGPRSDDLVKRNFTADSPDKLWITDLALVSAGRAAVAGLIKDVFSRRIVAWHIPDTADTALVLTALEYALASS